MEDCFKVEPRRNLLSAVKGYYRFLGLSVFDAPDASSVNAA